MSGRGSARSAARLLCAAAACAISIPAVAQTGPPAPPPIDPAQLDPSAPLAPMPDLGVDWPDLNAKDEAPPVAAPNPQPQAATEEESTGDRKYSVSVEGLNSVGNVEDVLTAFRQQSALEGDRNKAANSAQIDRRSRADADLLEELLRSQGYYDADVEPRTERAGDAVKVILEAAAGEQYRFASVDLPGLEAAGPEATKLRAAFAVKAGDPVIAQDVIAGGIALQTALGELGFAGAKVGEQQVEVDHVT